MVMETFKKFRKWFVKRLIIFERVRSIFVDNILNECDVAVVFAKNLSSFPTRPAHLFQETIFKMKHHEAFYQSISTTCSCISNSNIRRITIYLEIKT